MRWEPVPIIGGAYSDDTKPFSVQDTVNWIPEVAERPNGRSNGLLRDAPGFEDFAELVAGSEAPTGPVRGLHNVEGALFAVAGNGLYRVNTDATVDFINEIPGAGRVSMAHNQITGGNVLVIANGMAAYTYNTATETFAKITDDGFPGARVVDFVDSYIAFTEPAGRFWAHSELAQATEYNTLDRYEAESAPDKIVGLIVSHREVIVGGERTTEIFRNTGAATGTFQRADGTEMERGWASPWAVARLDNTIYFLGNDGIVYRLEGYQPIRVSTTPIEQELSRRNLANAFAFTFESRGHKIFYLTCPDGYTFGYDVATGEWHRRQSYGLKRWRLNHLVYWDGEWIGSDYREGKLYRLDWSLSDEAGAPLERRRVTGVLHDNQNRLTVCGLELVVETGNGRWEVA